jgi:hypothetical protein
MFNPSSERNDITYDLELRGLVGDDRPPEIATGYT